MPYVDVEVYVSDEDIREAVRGSNYRNDSNFSIPQRNAMQTLNDAADYFRRVGDHAMAFKLEEIREDFVK